MTAPIEPEVPQTDEERLEMVWSGKDTLPVDDSRMFLDRYKRDTPAETILAMLAEPTLTIDCRSERYAGGFVEIRVSGRVFNTYQLLDALKRYRASLIPEELRESVVVAAHRMREATEDFMARANKLPDDMRGEVYAIAHGKNK